MSVPKLSVCLITYNHEGFIRQTWEGILMQQCNFDFEIVVGLDKGTDRTEQILKECIEKSPRPVKLLSTEQNLGMVDNWMRTLFACEGEYVAILEGDDYWTDPTKLQKQVDLLDRHPDYAFAFHDVNVQYDNTAETQPLAGVRNKSVFELEDIILNPWFIPTCSVVYRNKFLPRFPKWLASKKLIDIPVEMLLASQGAIGYIGERLATYRIHTGGVSHIQWSGKEKVFEFSTIPVFKAFDKFTNGKYRQLIRKRLEKDYLQLMKKNTFLSIYYLRALMGYLRVDSRNLLSLRKLFADRYYGSTLYEFYKRRFKDGSHPGS